jgi:hypothetical protein
VVEQVLIAMGVMVGLMVISTGVVAVVVVRGVRRRYRALKGRLRVVRVRTNPPGRSLHAQASLAVATLGSPRWWAVQNRRHRMWRAVESAENAVGVADRSEVAVGELPMLASQLRSAAEGVDAVLRAGMLSGPLRPEDRADCERIEAAAADIRGAALSMLRTAARADADPLVSAVRIEVAALDAGVRAAQG